MRRHQGKYKADNQAPYELSRTAIEKMVRCEACFWLEKVKGVKTPGLPGFNLNTNTDTLLKKDFDAVRGREPHALMEAAGLTHLRPFWHEDIAKWAESMHFGAEGRFHFDHPETNIRFGGGLDDVWENIETGELHIVDYKSSYRRQMDMYQWIARQLGFEVSDTGYFVYVDGQHREESGMLDGDNPWQAWMRFNVSVIPYEGNDSWVEDALRRAKYLVSEVDECPDHATDCEYGQYLAEVAALG